MPVQSTVLRGPVRLADAEAPENAPAPAMGEHTEILLAEAGFTAAEIAALRQDGAI